jgi:hypothetical protein
MGTPHSISGIAAGIVMLKIPINSSIFKLKILMQIITKSIFKQAEIGSMENGEPMMAQQLFAASRFLNWAQTNPQEIAVCF